MIQIIARWIKPWIKTSLRSAYDVVHLKDDTYAWADYNTNNLVSHPCSYRDLSHLEPIIWNLIANKIKPDIFGESTVPDETRAVDKNAPHNNDGRRDCYKCHQSTRIAGGGAYHVCKNEGCAWYDN